MLKINNFIQKENVNWSVNRLAWLRIHLPLKSEPGRLASELGQQQPQPQPHLTEPFQVKITT